MTEERLHEDFRRIRPALVGELVRLRARESEDLPHLNEMFNDPDVRAGLQLVWSQPLAGIREWFERTRTDATMAVFVIETLSGEAVGICSLENINERSREALLGVWIGKPYWDRGYGTDAMRVLCRYGFRYENLQRIELLVLETNERARTVYERVGFRHEGTLRRKVFLDGTYVDALVMGLLVEESQDL